MDEPSKVLQIIGEIQDLMNQNCINDTFYPISNKKFIFPISNEECFEAFETELKNESYMSLMITHLSNFAGNKVVHLIKKIMTALFDDEVLANYSYTGKGIIKKKKFSDLNINSVITIAALKQGSTYQTEVEKHIKAYLTQVPYRLLYKARQSQIENTNQEYNKEY